MHGAEHGMRCLFCGKDRISASCLVADYNPVGSPVTGTGTDKRFSVACHGETYLTSWHFIGLKEPNTETAVLDGVDVESRTPIGIPPWRFLHVHIIPAVQGAYYSRDAPTVITGFSESGLYRSRLGQHFSLTPLNVHWRETHPSQPILPSPTSEFLVCFILVV